MARGHVQVRRAAAVVGVCAVVVAVPVGFAEAASTTPGPGSIITVTDCGDGLTLTLGGTSIVTVGLPGDDCPTGTATPSPSASPTYPICTLPPPPSTPAPSTSRATTPAPRIAQTSAPPRPAPRPQTVPQSIPTPPQPTPTPTPKRTTPKPATSSPVMIVPTAQTFHSTPFKRLSTVLIVFVIAIVPVTIARMRHRRRG